ncbi:phenylalanine--tRNA ligase subunit beta [Aquipuribacter sp. SD81]|uniref:phenylalanine--tRNA ligase subunit beta n=1 Tax=Aquipuribacter sp. SD81 TaxID=3127703 RepID=UPI003018FEBA
MRVPLPWLGEHVRLPEGASAAEVAADLVRVGLEEEGVHGGDVTGPLVVGRVLSAEPEPQKNGKTINWCSVDVGAHGPDGPDGPTREPRGIVCGAHNFGPGDLVVVALPGAVLPGPFPIASRRTYGHVSDGMICSARELGLGEDHDGILVLTRLGVDLDGVEPGHDAVELLGLRQETVEVNVTPDRGYCLSVRGVAREYAHATGAAFRDPVDDLVPPAATEAGWPVRLADDAPLRGRAGCDRFVARVVRGIDPTAPTPFWLQRRLVQAGMRPISLAVDVTNYVMLALGQPLHAYDAALLSGPVVVRRARAGERLTTLDGVDRALDPEDLLITDSGDGSYGAEGSRVLGLAGVMGGADTEVSGATRDVLLEAAHFDAVSTGRTARRHRLASEASRRFERGVDPLLAPAAAELAVRLLTEHGGGTPDPAWTDLRELPEPTVVSLDPTYPERLVGVAYSADEVVATLEQVGCTVERWWTELTGTPRRETLAVTPPSWRPDLTGPADLVEEVARLRGYADIPERVPTPPPGAGLTAAQRAVRRVREHLVSRGLVEVLSYPFVSAASHDALGLPEDDPRRRALRLLNPLSDEQPEMRTNVLATLLDTASRNLGRGEGDLAVFEVGAVVRPSAEPVSAGVPGVAQRPSATELAALDAAVPSQPRHLAAVLAGAAEPAGWQGPGRAAAWDDAVDVARQAVAAAGTTLTVRPAEQAPWHPGRCAELLVTAGGPDPRPAVVGHAGELHPRVCQALGLPARTCAVELDLDAVLDAALDAGADRVVQAQPLSRHPLAKEDLALVAALDVPAAAVEAALVAGAGDLLEGIRLFDVYTGPQVAEGHRSLAYALRFRAPDRTLTAEEVTAARDGALRAAEAVGARLRS